MKKFKIWSLDNSGSISIDIGKFPGGEIRVRLSQNEYTSSKPNGVHILAHLFNSDDVMTLVMITDALRNWGVEKIRLTMPYIPYARQDRVCNDGEAFSIKAFARIINSLDFSSVVVWDAHSEVSTALIDRCINEPRYRIMDSNSDVVEALQNKKGPWYILSPDAGALKKTYETVRQMPGAFDGIITADKERDLETGKIIRTNVTNIPVDIANATVLIADDICDGGRTFAEIADWFTDAPGRSRPKELNLFVTHGIFSRGMEPLSAFDNVWCAVNFKDYE